jgi:hypothetical protein
MLWKRISINNHENLNYESSEIDVFHPLFLRAQSHVVHLVLIALPIFEVDPVSAIERREDFLVPHRLCPVSPAGNNHARSFDNSKLT